MESKIAQPSETHAPHDEFAAQEEPAEATEPTQEPPSSDGRADLDNRPASKAGSGALARVARAWGWVEEHAEEFAQGGAWGYVAPLLLGWALAASGSTLLPAMGPWLHRKFGGLIMVALWSLLIGGGALVLHRKRRVQHPELKFSQTGEWLGLRFAFLGALPMFGVLKGSLEAKHPFQVLTFGTLAATCVGLSVYAWSAPQRASLGASDDVKSKRWNWLSAVALGLMVGAYTWVFSKLSIDNHLSFNTSRADLGFYVSIFRRSSLGDLLGCSLCGGGNHLSGHFDPILVLLSPVFWILPKAQTVLVLQSLWLGSSAVPLFLLARHFGLSRVQGLLLGVALFCYPALHGANLFDFHSLVLLVPLMLWWLWSWMTGRTRLYWVMFALVLLTREDAALVSVFVGLFVLMTGGKRAVRTGLITMGIAAAYFVFVKGVLMDGADPLRPGKGRGYAYYYASLVPKGQGTAGLVNSVFSNPAALLKTIFTEPKLLFVLQILLPLGFLPLLAKRGKVLLIYGFAFTLLATREYVPSMHFHYASLLVPFAFFLSARALGELKQHGLVGLPGPKLSAALLGAVLVSSGVAGWKFGGVIPNRTFKAGFSKLERNPKRRQIEESAALDAFCKTVPRDKVVATASSLLPHLARCPSIILRSQRYRADLVVWRQAGGTDNRRVRREIERGQLVEVADIGFGYKAYKTKYTKAQRKRLSAIAKGRKPAKSSHRKKTRKTSSTTRKYKKGITRKKSKAQKLLELQKEAGSQKKAKKLKK